VHYLNTLVSILLEWALKVGCFIGFGYKKYTKFAETF